MLIYFHLAREEKITRGTFFSTSNKFPAPLLNVSRFYWALSFVGWFLFILREAVWQVGRHWVGFMFNLLWLLGRWIGLNLFKYFCYFYSKEFGLHVLFSRQILKYFFTLLFFGSNWRIIGGFWMEGFLGWEALCAICCPTSDARQIRRFRTVVRGRSKGCLSTSVWRRISSSWTKLLFLGNVQEMTSNLVETD